MIKTALGFLKIISLPIKIIGKLFLKLILVKIYHWYFSCKKQTENLFNQKNQTIFSFFIKSLPICLFFSIASWTIIDHWQLKKITAEEIGDKSLLNLITTSPEEYEVAEEIIEGPIADLPTDQLSYLGEEAISPPLPIAPIPEREFAYTTEEETVLITPGGIIPGQIITRTEIIDYLVQSGDTISSIAKRFNININSILWTNNLSFTSLIKPGQVLKILPVSGTSHQVKKGENLASIAKKYQADLQKIIEFNKLASTDIQIGQNLIIPEGIKPATYIPRSPATIKNIFIPPAALESGTRLQWPILSRYITQYFGWRHTGIDIGDKLDNPVYAAGNGKVEYAGWTRGYGYNIIINHGSGLKTLYAHNSKLYVTVGESVARGQVIAAVGSTGWSTGPHLHFEVIVSGVKKNPLNYVR